MLLRNCLKLEFNPSNYVNAVFPQAAVDEFPFHKHVHYAASFRIFAFSSVLDVYREVRRILDTAAGVKRILAFSANIFGIAFISEFFSNTKLLQPMLCLKLDLGEAFNLAIQPWGFIKCTMQLSSERNSQSSISQNDVLLKK